MKGLRLTTACSSLCLGLIYVGAFIYFGAFSAFPVDGTSLEKLHYLAAHRVELTGVYFSIYVVFGIVLALLVVGLNEIYKASGIAPSGFAAVFGVIWAGLVVASGLVFTVGLGQSADLLGAHPDDAVALWRAVSVVGESIGGGNEIVGGVWVLLVSALGLRFGVLPRGLHGLGCVVGAAGVATLYPAEVITEIFGVSQIVWFLWLGMAMLKMD